MTTMRLLILFISLVAIFGPTASTAKDKVVTCYYAAGGSYWNGHDADTDSWPDAVARYEVTDIDTTSCTHLIYSFAHLDTATWTIKSSDEALDLPLNTTDGTYWWYEGRDNFKNFTDLKSKDVKTLISIGGAEDSKELYNGVSKYSALASDSVKRTKFNIGVVKFLKKHNFDGLDLDWEFPGNKDKANFATWVNELRTAFNNKGNYNKKKKLLLTAAVGNPGEAGYDHAKLYKELDYVHIMAYDFNGWWKKSSTTTNTWAGHNAPLNKVKTLVKKWTDKTIKKSKLVVGVGLYGRSFTLTEGSDHKPGNAVSGAGKYGIYPNETGLLSYADICNHTTAIGTKKWTLVETNGAAGAYAYHEADKQWVGFDDVILAKQKANYVKDDGLAGVLVWSIDYADWNNKCKGGKYPIVTAMGGILNPKVKPKRAKLN